MRALRALLAIPAALVVALLVGCNGGQPSATSADASYRQVSATEAQELMASEEGYVIVDVRTPEEYDSGHIPGAVNVPNEEIGSEDPEALPDKGQLVLVYCRSGNRSVQAAEKLAALGYTNVVEFGGITSWPGETE